MLVFSQSLVLSLRENPTYWPDSPLIGWRNVVGFENVEADKEAVAHPAVNLANANTNLRWQGVDATPHTISVGTGQTPVDYVGIAGHNFGSAGVAVLVDAEEQDEPGTFTPLIDEFMPSNNDALFLRFEPKVTTRLRVRLTPGNGIAPRASVLYAGQVLIMNRGIEQGYTPLVYGVTTEVQTNRAEIGAFLGRVLKSRSVQSSATFRFLDPAWFRVNMRPFLRFAQEEPFFFAWAPATHPEEASYAWLTRDPTPTIPSGDGSFDVTLDMSGLAA